MSKRDAYEKPYDETGIIETDKGTVQFVALDHRFTFMSPYAYEYMGRNDPICLRPDEYGFLHGMTHNGHEIAIYVSTEFYLMPVRVVRTYLYIISDGNMEMSGLDGFIGIQFEGGVLSRLYLQELSGIKYEPNQFAIERKRDTVSIEYVNKELLDRIELERNICGTISRTKGIRIGHGHPQLTILTGREERLGSFPKYYQTVLTMCQFMSFRENVGFKKILLLRHNDNVGFPTSYATCYIRKNYTSTRKDESRFITFKELGSSIEKLYEMIAINEENHATYNVNFLPESDANVFRIDNSKIRRVCSAVESELDLSEIDFKTDKNLQELIAQIRGLIREHRKGEHRLSDGTYDVIQGNIRHWDKPLAEKIMALKEKHHNELELLRKKYHTDLTEKMIREFVKYRNDITHGIYGILTKEVWVASIFLMALVYCSVLSRIGMEPEMIKEIMDRGFIS